MKYLLVLLALIPVPAFAAMGAFLNDIVVDSQTIIILNSYSVASALLLGFITSGLVYWNARKMRGGVFGKAFLYLACGMFFALLAFTIGSVSFVSGTVTATNFKLAHDFFFMAGYVLMAIGGNHIFKALNGK